MANLTLCVSLVSGATFVETGEVPDSGPIVEWHPVFPFLFGGLLPRKAGLQPQNGSFLATGCSRGGGGEDVSAQGPARGNPWASTSVQMCHEQCTTWTLL